MLTNGFALFRGEGAATLAARAGVRVRRYAKERLVSAGGEFAQFDPVNVPEGKEVIFAFALQSGGGLPLVHGYLGEGDGPLEGEFCILEKKKGEGVYARRDSLGTRGLWMLPWGPNAGSIASDYRMLPPGGPVLLPPRTVYPDGRLGKQRGSEIRDARAQSFEAAVTALAYLIDESVRRRAQGHERVSVSFSGGLDSSLLALVASRHSKVVLCSAFAPGSRDERQTERAAALLGLRLETLVLDRRSIARSVSEAELPPGAATAMDKALWCIYSATSRLAAESGVRMILVGQLADELFGGYKKYTKALELGPGAAEKMMRQDARACADRGFLRDEAACSATCEVRFPFAEERIASFADSLPVDYKIKGEERKRILRAAALRLGLPEELAMAPKKAAQFSSGATKLLRTL